MAEPVRRRRDVTTFAFGQRTRGGENLTSNRIGEVARLVVVAIVLAATALPMTAKTASAHLPSFDTGGESYETAEIIDNLDTSYAFYGEVQSMVPGSSTGAKYYAFEGTGGQELKFELGRKDFFFAPCVLLVGPGLPGPDEVAQNIINSSGLSLPAGAGAMGWSLVFLPWIDYIGKSEFEPFTQTTFYYTYRESVVLPSDGIYYFVVTGVVYSEELGEYQASSGRYFLVTGYKEEFTVLDFVLMPWYWLKVQSFWSDHGEVLFIWPTAMVVIILLAVEVFTRTKDETFSRRTKPGRLLYFAALTGSFLMIGGAVNQLSLLGLSSFEHGLEGIVFLVLALQLGGLALGVLSTSFSKKRFFNMNAASLAPAVVITGIALVLGAGLIAGPLLFIGSIVVMMYVDRGMCRDKPKGEESVQPHNSRDS